MDIEKTPGRKKFEAEYTPQLSNDDRKNSVPPASEVIKSPAPAQAAGRKWFGGK